MNLAHLLLRSGRWLADRPALGAGKKGVLSYGTLAARVSQLAFSLGSKFNLSPGDRVALALKNCPQYYEILFACWHAGLVAVPMNAKLHAKEFAYIVENSGAKLCFTTPDLESTVPSSISVTSKQYEKFFAADERNPTETKPDDPGCVLSTHVSTGVPKGAVLTHRNMLFQAQAYFS